MTRLEFTGHADLLATLEATPPDELATPAIKAICRTLDRWDARWGEEIAPEDDGDTGAWTADAERAHVADAQNDEEFLWGGV